MCQADSVSKVLLVLITTNKCEHVDFPPTEDYCSKWETSYHSDLLQTENLNFSAIIFGAFCKAVLPTKHQPGNQCMLLTSSLCNGERQVCVGCNTPRHLSETTALWCLSQCAIGTKQAAAHFQALSITNYAPKCLFFSLLSWSHIKYNHSISHFANTSCISLGSFQYQLGIKFSISILASIVEFTVSSSFHGAFPVSTRILQLSDWDENSEVDLHSLREVEGYKEQSNWKESIGQELSEEEGSAGQEFSKGNCKRPSIQSSWGDDSDNKFAQNSWRF